MFKAKELGRAAQRLRQNNKTCPLLAVRSRSRQKVRRKDAKKNKIRITERLTPMSSDEVQGIDEERETAESLWRRRYRNSEQRKKTRRNISLNGHPEKQEGWKSTNSRTDINEEGLAGTNSLTRAALWRGTLGPPTSGPPP